MDGLLREGQGDRKERGETVEGVYIRRQAEKVVFRYCRQGQGIHNECSRH
jgi:hypothetical protein